MLNLAQEQIKRLVKHKFRPEVVSFVRTREEKLLDSIIQHEYRNKYLLIQLNI